MKRCQKCGKYVEDSADYCSFCGNGFKDEIKEKVKIRKVNYIAILGLFFAVIPALLSNVLNNIAIICKIEINGIVGAIPTVGGILLLVGLVLGIILPLIGLILSFKRGGFVISLLGLIVGLVVGVALITMAFRSELSFFDFIKTAALGGVII